MHLEFWSSFHISFQFEIVNKLNLLILIKLFKLKLFFFKTVFNSEEFFLVGARVGFKKLYVNWGPNCFK